MPLDSNIENNCIDFINDFSINCSYIIRNDYNEFNLNFAISAIIFNKPQYDSNQVYNYNSIKQNELNMRDGDLLVNLNNESEIYNFTNIYYIHNITTNNLNFILLKYSILLEKSISFISSFYDEKKIFILKYILPNYFK